VATAGGGGRGGHPSRRGVFSGRWRRGGHLHRRTVENWFTHSLFIAQTGCWACGMALAAMSSGAIIVANPCLTTGSVVWFSNSCVRACCRRWRWG
jgi:hypothetical protein